MHADFSLGRLRIRDPHNALQGGDLFERFPGSVGRLEIDPQRLVVRMRVRNLALQIGLPGNGGERLNVNFGDVRIDDNDQPRRFAGRVGRSALPVVIDRGNTKPVLAVALGANENAVRPASARSPHTHFPSGDRTKSRSSLIESRCLPSMRTGIRNVDFREKYFGCDGD